MGYAHNCYHMGRDVVRKLQADPGANHVLAKRNSAGTVQTTTSLKNTGISVTSTGLTTLTTYTVTSPSVVLFTTAKVQVKGTNSVTATLTRDGSTVASTKNTGTGTSASTVSNTHTTPLVGPQYKLKGKATGTGGTATVTLQRESQWSGSL